VQYFCLTPVVYPEVAALVGPAVPDLRGLFLRGLGGESTTLGTVQGDAIRNITAHVHGVYANTTVYSPGGAFTRSSWSGLTLLSDGSAPTLRDMDLRLDASRVVPTAAENRPVNMAVRYLIRAAR